MLCEKTPHESCGMGRRIVMMEMICSLGHYECDGPTVHKISQWRLTADWLAPGTVTAHGYTVRSPDWLPSYIKATRAVLEIFKIAGYFPDSPRIYKKVIRILCAGRTESLNTVRLISDTKLFTSKQSRPLDYLCPTTDDTNNLWPGTTCNLSYRFAFS